MAELIKLSFRILKEYSGNCTFMLMYAVSLCYLLIFEKDKVKKAVLAVAGAVFAVLFVFPIFSYFFINIMDEADTYYRFIWLWSTAIVSSYAAIRIIDRFKNKIVKIILFAVLIVCISIGGVYMYDMPTLFKAENAYQIPQCVIDMCDDMIIENREVEVVFPDEILQYPRLYSAYIDMPYGFDILQFQYPDDIHDIMREINIDTAELTKFCEWNHVHYLVLNKNRVLSEPVDNFNFEFFGSYGDYDVYKSTTMFFGQWEDYEEWLKENENKN